MFGKLIKNLGRKTESDEGSFAVTDEELIKSFTNNPDFPYLVSFPRTGSHWLRLLMELYFKKPSLVRAFYFKDQSDFTCYHTHDDDLKLRRRVVLYLYRNPTPTIYSQLSYYDENCDDRNRIAHWSTLYGQHLKKWLVTEDFTTSKVKVTYEGLKTNLTSEFAKICQLLGAPFEEARLIEAASQVTKENLKQKTHHDEHVVNLSKSYDQERENFRAKHGRFVMETVMAQDPILRDLFA